MTHVGKKKQSENLQLVQGRLSWQTNEVDISESETEIMSSISIQDWSDHCRVMSSYLYIIHYTGNCLSQEEVLLLVNSVDKDGDGVLDFEEFVNVMMERWSFYDVFHFILLLPHLLEYIFFLFFFL